MFASHLKNTGGKSFREPQTLVFESSLGRLWAVFEHVLVIPQVQREVFARPLRGFTPGVRCGLFLQAS